LCCSASGLGKHGIVACDGRCWVAVGGPDTDRGLGVNSEADLIEAAKNILDGRSTVIRKLRSVAASWLARGHADVRTSVIVTER
jgi:hypothetical protein